MTAAVLDTHDVAGHLRQMIAVLEDERQALASLDPDGLTEAAQIKEALCERLAGFGGDALGPEARDLAATAQALNDVNRRVRNLLAANVAARLEALGQSRHAYQANRSAQG